MRTQNESYNGWKNYETWNVALWIQNDEGLYSYAKTFSRKGYQKLAVELMENTNQTPDGVRWDDSNLDLDALNEMLGEL